MKMSKVFGVVAVLALSAAQAFSAGRDIYPDPADAKADIAAALKTAAATHKRVIIDFGGNWCGDCQVLDIYFHNAENRPILESNFVLVHVNIGHMDENVDIAQRYGVPLDRGVPALAVLSDTGKLLYSQKSGEFEAMRRMQASSVTSFLVQWKPTKPGCSVMMVTC
ncbi:MAG TPA: thioredoxin family protein [Terracidiphilus sp.]|nr:thioredoxin family protein [Terracidiphilus sp.]